MANYFTDNAFFSSPFFKGDYFKQDFYKEAFFGGNIGCGGGTPAPSKPAKVGAITITGVTQTELKADWAQVANASKYNVSIKKVGESTPVTGYPKDISINSEAFTGLHIGTSYGISIKACNVAGCAAVTTKNTKTAGSTK